MGEPVSIVIGAVSVALKVGSAAVEVFLHRNGPISHLQRLVRADLNRDGELTEDQRVGSVRAFRQIHTDPTCVGALYRYIERGEADALDDVDIRIKELADADEATAIMRSVANRISNVIERGERVSFEARVTRSEFKRAAEKQNEQLEGMEAKLDRLLEDRERPSIVLFLDWVPERRRKDLAKLGESHSELVAELDKVMSPVAERDRPAHAAKLLLNRPGWLEEAPPTLLAVLARFAEEGGIWDLSADIWEEIAHLYGDQEKTDQEHEALMNASVSAHVAGEEQRRLDLLDLVRSECSDHPRLLLEEANGLETGAQRLALLDGLESEDDDIKALLSCHRGLAHLLEDDLDSAKAELEIAQEIDPDRLQVKMFSINVSIESGRRAIRENTPIPGDTLRNALAEAAETREKLIEQSRFQEAVRCLMLGADAEFLLSGPVGAGQLLATISNEELETPDAPTVIGEVALRIQAPLLALAVTSGLEGNMEVRRIRAAAKVRLEGVGTEFVLEACRELDGLVEQESIEGEMAAIMRLIACLHNPAIPWSDEANARLERIHLKEAAICIHAITHARREGLDAADRLIDAAEFSSERIRAECRFQCALETELREETAKRARQLLEAGTDQVNRQLCATALVNVGDIDRARAEARSLLDDLSSPRFVREEMHALLTKTAVDAEDWGEASIAVAAWLKEFPKDNTANWLRAQIAAQGSKSGS